ncbi:MAG TPA: thioredoxin domain-containing protein [Microbacterium sp.]|uniref:DsbA family protein n=1 Tax=Microbacterium sp. TaxID=51671 RepID=UPI002C4CF706|nr:thioredoxin domain-containing protein [Microbacterium sp.]HWI31624.1 thioredoxin domain-containing protein [Microbacterium sp.]
MATGGRKTNWFAIWVSVAVVAVLVVVGVVVVVLNNQATAPGEPPQSANIDAKTGAIHVGDGPDVVATYVDFMCPVCGAFEEAYGETLAGLVDDGSITLDIHPIAILDSKSQGTAFSTRAANAMYCVAESSPDASLAFLQEMFANQPPEPSAGLTDDQIIAFAETAGAAGAAPCIADQTYAKFVTAMTQSTPPDPATGNIGTPTVVVNGERLTLTGDPQVDIVDRLQG